MVADDVVDGGGLVHVLADKVVGAQDGDLIFTRWSSSSLLLADDPDARVGSQCGIRLFLWLADYEILDAVHLLEARLEGVSVRADFPEAHVGLRLVPEKAIFACVVEEGGFAQDGVD